MYDKLKLQVTTVTNAGKEPEKETNALPMALAIVAAFSETSVETEGILSRYLDGCRKLVKRPVFKAYCRNCGIDVGLRQEIVVMLTQDDETELIENTASILARNDLVPVIHGNEAERSSSGHSVVAGGRSNSCMTVHETWDKIKKTGKFMSVRERKSLIC